MLFGVRSHVSLGHEFFRPLDVERWATKVSMLLEIFACEILFEVGIRLCSELAAVALQRQIRLEESRCAAVPVRLSDSINLTVRLIQVHGDFGLR